MLKERKPPQRRLTSAESDPGFGFRSGYRSQNVVDSLPYPHQSFRRVP